MVETVGVRTNRQQQQQTQAQQEGGHTVRRGDTLSGIAQQNGVSLQELLASNPQIKNPDLIHPGQQVNLPNRNPAAAAGEAPASQPRSHTFQRGDALGNIAKENGLSLQQLMSANPEIRDPRRVRAGTEIRIPDRNEVQTNPRVGGPDARAAAAGRLNQNGVNRQQLEAQVGGANNANTTNGANTVNNTQPRPNANGVIDPRNLPTTGASARTARQDRAPAGVEGSRTMARNDEQHVGHFQKEFRAAGARHNIDPSILAAIASRESRGGNALDRNGAGDGGNGHGLMQVDRRYHTPAGGPFSAAHINQAAGILGGFRDQLARENPSWTPEQVMKGAISAYNRGTRGLNDPNTTDSRTTGHDYANDVIARAQYYKERGF